ncbi:MAG TPA: hypothetical protein VLE47_00240 [Candidatus Saccharimonadales bacterium]|nr:hypothetical protein [Candidatus Saccharimonadales bacterium]
MVTQLANPITLEGKLAAVESEKRVLAERYNYKKRKANRFWDPFQIAREGVTADHFNYSDNLKVMVPGFFEVESLEARYTAEGFLTSGSSQVGRDIYEIWGGEERAHYLVLLLGLIDSDWYTREEIDQFQDVAIRGSWSFESQTGLKPTIIRGGVFTVGQEDNTGRNYYQLMRLAWREQGSPVDGNGHPIYRGWSYIFYLLWRDESAHLANFLLNLLVDMKYFPSETFQAIFDVLKKYRMPKITLSDPEAFVKAIMESGVSSLRVPISVIKDARNKFGLEDNTAVLRAIKEWNKLPVDSLIRLTEKVAKGVDRNPHVEDGAVNIYELNTDGTFTLVSAKAV